MGNTHKEITIGRAESNLQRQLDWIGRYDARISFVTGICIGMIGLLVGIVPAPDKWTTVLCISFFATIGLLIVSLVYVYLGQYPKTDSPNQSLLFFGTIAKLKHDEFNKNFKAASDDDYLEDLLSQCHINAQILSKKFYVFKRALILMLIAVVPWAIAIYIVKLIPVS